MKLQMQMQITPTATLTLTPTLTPTPDLRGAEQIYTNIQELLAKKPQTIQDWDTFIGALDSLRKIAPAYHAAEIDGDYYTALHQRGIAKIFANPCQDITLEGGIYDLTLAERFGPLDAYSDSLRTYSRFYIAGASYWELDWVQAQYYFGQVMAAYPELRDSSCQTASNRWRYATIKYGDQLMNAGDLCGASDQYAAAFSVDSPENATVYPTATSVYNTCHPPAPPTPTPTKTPTKKPKATKTH